MFSFSEHIRELTIEFTCLLEIQLSKTTSVPLFSKEDTLGVLFLTVYVTIKIPGASLHTTNQVINIKLVLLPNISFDFSS